MLGRKSSEFICPLFQKSHLLIHLCIPTTVSVSGHVSNGANSKTSFFKKNYSPALKKNLTFANAIGNKTLRYFNVFPILTECSISEFQIFLKILGNTGAVKSKFLIQEFNVGCNLFMRILNHMMPFRVNIQSNLGA